MVVGEFTVGADLLIIGGGPGGYAAAIRASLLGMSVTLVEKSRVGGVCLHEGCIPSKAIISQADLYHRMKQASSQGMLLMNATVEMERLQVWKQTAIDQLAQGVTGKIRGSGIHVVQGEAAFVSENEVRVIAEHGSERYRFQQCIVATGSIPVELPAFPIDGNHILSSTDALNLKRIPKRLVVIGGGYIGLELGTAYRKLGSEVIVLESTNQLLSGTDEGLVRVLTKNLKKLGIDVYLHTYASQFHRENGEVLIEAVVQGERLTFVADQVLVTVGRIPNIADMNLQQAGIAIDKHGFILTNNQLRTTNPKVYAAGDAVGHPMLAHKATYEGKVAAEVIAGLASTKDASVIPSVIFTDPEIASVGLTEKQALEKGFKVSVGRALFFANGRTHFMESNDGYVQVIADHLTKQILGVHIAGPEAATVIAEAALAIEMCSTVYDLTLTIHAHPTWSETLAEAAEFAQIMSSS
ncbi:dihydrolipoyl dehydrogenase [Paenibacillus aestuarii]|uniref:Dihydrolipoyl dehydrogenase n=1 Tax=Paenibacillus aestuarii TaxID=516965 RepID=A0ABW0K983_9BACL|nr:dihydrolipoyl dehydrogenase [Paenibacillus aestuarii]